MISRMRGWPGVVRGALSASGISTRSTRTRGGYRRTRRGNGKGRSVAEGRKVRGRPQDDGLVVIATAEFSGDVLLQIEDIRKESISGRGNVVDIEVIGGRIPDGKGRLGETAYGVRVGRAARVEADGAGRALRTGGSMFIFIASVSGRKRGESKGGWLGRLLEDCVGELEEGRESTEEEIEGGRRLKDKVDRPVTGRTTGALVWAR
ncbi:hypothetical protein BJ912DRAFT_935528 [Pholiota molesta]|nr:hypothetical protein BJ912DRAFT_935528 [Pholiota molesta]